MINDRFGISRFVAIIRNQRFTVFYSLNYRKIGGIGRIQNFVLFHMKHIDFSKRNIRFLLRGKR